MTDEARKVAAKLSKAQRDALLEAAEFIDLCAGEGMGQWRPDKPTLFAEDVAMVIWDAFDLDSDLGFVPAVRDILARDGGEG